MEQTGVFRGKSDTLPAHQAGRVFLSEEGQMQLSPSQEQAVCHGSGPALVLAGPGSGKTFVITRRVACLIHEKKADPAGILVVTFSRAAALTMRKRYLELAGNEGDDAGTPVVFGTFHSVFFQILKAAYHYTAASILKEEQRAQILRDLIDGYRIEGNDRKELMENLSAEISRVKNEEMDLQYFYSSVTASDTFRSVFRSYQQALEAAGLIDFDDMLIYTKELLERRPDILQAWQKRFTHILVDEFQDINLLQYRIIRMLALPQNNLFVVGDDDQSIYRFRGAKPEIMLGFSDDYPDAVLIRLQENYRSGDEVIQAAMKVISANRSRYPKQIRGVRGYPGSVRVAGLKNVREESEFLIRQIRSAVKEGMAYSDMAVLTRTNAAGRY
ncbi:MAG: ATP-dependent helicase, partial [Lachnospiraceae bacterium]|nr:ATP-dependent helicase [Lachnospiraceae bacterium]